MYNVGFGDCFLLFFPHVDRDYKVLIDCGSLKKSNKAIRDIAKDVIESCRDSDGVARIDIVVMTHRHADHISGFIADLWNEVEVREVWMPWMECRKDPTARMAMRAMERSLEKLTKAFAAAKVPKELEEVLLNARSNSDALELLHEGFSGNPKRRFLPTEDRAVEVVTTSALPGDIKVFALGPPRDSHALKKEEAKGESFLDALNLDHLVPVSGEFFPLGRDWEEDPPLTPVEDKAEIDKMIESLDSYEAVAAAVDTKLNNTSLILIFQVGSDYWLFTGDAQWGPWERLLADDDAVDLLSKVTFVKIGHHGSHNASPVSLFKEYLGKKNGSAAKVYGMISVTPYSQWQGVPHQPLIDALAEMNYSVAISKDLSGTPDFVWNKDLWCEVSFHGKARS